MKIDLSKRTIVFIFVVLLVITSTIAVIAIRVNLTRNPPAELLGFQRIFNMSDGHGEFNTLQVNTQLTVNAIEMENPLRLTNGEGYLCVFENGTIFIKDSACS